MAIADDIKALGEEIEASYGARVAAVQDLVKETRKTLEGFQADHRRMAKALKTDLAQGESQRLEDFKAMNAAIKRSVEAIFKETARLLSDFSKEQKEMAAALRKVLAEGESARLEDFRPMLAEIQRRQKDRIAEVKGLLGEFHKAQEEAHKAWQSLAKTMASKRAGKVAPLKPTVAKRVEVEEVAEVKEKTPAEKPMTYREFFAYHQPRLKGSAKERMRKIGAMWAQYKSAQGIG